MFPLGSVLVPGMVLPLHVFEDRYRALVDRCLEGDREFGVVLIERGSEVGGGEVRSRIGTVAEIARAERFDDGRWAIIAVGTRRFQVADWLDDDPYPRADVVSWPDEPVDDDAALAAAYAEQLGLLRRVLALANELGADVSPLVEVSDDPVLGSHQLAVLSPLGPLDRQRLLAAPNATARLALAGELLTEEVAVLEAQIAGGWNDRPEG